MELLISLCVSKGTPMISMQNKITELLLDPQRCMNILTVLAEEEEKDDTTTPMRFLLDATLPCRKIEEEVTHDNEDDNEYLVSQIDLVSKLCYGPNTDCIDKIKRHLKWSNVMNSLTKGTKRDDVKAKYCDLIKGLFLSNEDSRALTKDRSRVFLASTLHKSGKSADPMENDEQKQNIKRLINWIIDFLGQCNQRISSSKLLPKVLELSEELVRLKYHTSDDVLCLCQQLLNLIKTYSEACSTEDLQKNDKETTNTNEDLQKNDKETTNTNEVLCRSLDVLNAILENRLSKAHEKFLSKVTNNSKVSLSTLKEITKTFMRFDPGNITQDPFSTTLQTLLKNAVNQDVITKTLHVLTTYHSAHAKLLQEVEQTLVVNNKDSSIEAFFKEVQKHMLVLHSKLDLDDKKEKITEIMEVYIKKLTSDITEERKSDMRKILLNMGILEEVLGIIIKAKDAIQLSINNSQRSQVRMKYEKNRKDTFKSKWKGNVSEKELAKLGFYCIESGIVKCAFCQLVLKVRSVLPIKRHKRYGRNCPFVKDPNECGNVPSEADWDETGLSKVIAKILEMLKYLIRGDKMAQENVCEYIDQLMSLHGDVRDAYGMDKRLAQLFIEVFTDNEERCMKKSNIIQVIIRKIKKCKTDVPEYFDLLAVIAKGSKQNNPIPTNVKLILTEFMQNYKDIFGFLDNSETARKAQEGEANGGYFVAVVNLLGICSEGDEENNRALCREIVKKDDVVGRLKNYQGNIDVNVCGPLFRYLFWAYFSTKERGSPGEIKSEEIDSDTAQPDIVGDSILNFLKCLLSVIDEEFEKNKEHPAVTFLFDKSYEKLAQMARDDFKSDLKNCLERLDDYKAKMNKTMLGVHQDGGQENINLKLKSIGQSIKEKYRRTGPKYRNEDDIYYGEEFESIVDIFSRDTDQPEDNKRYLTGKMIEFITNSEKNKQTAVSEEVRIQLQIKCLGILKAVIDKEIDALPDHWKDDNIRNKRKLEKIEKVQNTMNTKDEIEEMLKQLGGKTEDDVLMRAFLQFLDRMLFNANTQTQKSFETYLINTKGKAEFISALTKQIVASKDRILRKNEIIKGREASIEKQKVAIDAEYKKERKRLEKLIPQNKRFQQAEKKAKKRLEDAEKISRLKYQEENIKLQEKGKKLIEELLSTEHKDAKIKKETEILHDLEEAKKEDFHNRRREIDYSVMRAKLLGSLCDGQKHVIQEAMRQSSSNEKDQNIITKTVLFVKEILKGTDNIEGDDDIIELVTELFKTIKECIAGNKENQKEALKNGDMIASINGLIKIISKMPLENQKHYELQIDIGELLVYLIEENSAERKSLPEICKSLDTEAMSYLISTNIDKPESFRDETYL